MKPDDAPIKTLSSKEIYKNPWMTLTEYAVRFSSGRDGIYSVLDGRDGILVIAEAADGNLHILKEYRYPVAKYMWQLPSGGIEPGDTPLQTAQKELREELGLVADTWIDIGSFSPSYGGGMRDRQYVFVAHDLHKGETEHEDSEAIVEQEAVTQDQLWEMVRAGEFEDGQTLAALLRYKLWLEQ